MIRENTFTWITNFIRGWHASATIATRIMITYVYLNKTVNYNWIIRRFYILMIKSGISVYIFCFCWIKYIMKFLVKIFEIKNDILQKLPFIKPNCVKVSLKIHLLSQILPKKPSGHLQWKTSSISWQWPPFIQGLLWQSFCSIRYENLIDYE